MAKNKNMDPVAMGEFILANPSKLERVINGTVGRGGQLEGGIGDSASIEVKLAHYDKLGGLILTKDGEKVAMGSFWDFVNGCPKKSPVVSIEKDKTPSGPAVLTEEVDDKGPIRRGRKKKLED